MNEVLVGVISSLVSVVLVLGAILRFYLPRKVDNAVKNSNPHNPNNQQLAEMSGILREIKSTLDLHCQMAERDHQDIMTALGRIENKIK